MDIEKKEAPGAVETPEGKCLITGHHKNTKNIPHLNGLNPKRRNAPSDTRDESYLQVLQSGTSITQETITFTALSNCSEPQSCRDLSIRTGIEIAAMNRVLFNLKEANVIYIADKKQSKHTNRKVEHYSIAKGRTAGCVLSSQTSEADTVILTDNQIHQQESLFDGFLSPRNESEGSNG